MVKIICEAGKNFIITEQNEPIEVLLNRAKELALAAKNCGADIVKYQTHVWEDEQFLRAESRKEWTLRNERLTPFEEFWKPLKEYCDEIGIEFLSTGMSLLAAKKIESLVQRWKIPSGNLHDFELIEYVARSGKPIILSSGMSIQKEVDKAVNLIRQFNNDLTILQCTSEYPCAEDKVNLNIMKEYEWRYQTKNIGFSDHTLSLTIPAIAVAMGAVLIEKHFTFNRNAYGPDHKVSLLPEEFKEMVENIRWTEMVMGEKEKKLTEQEVKFRKIFRKV